MYAETFYEIKKNEKHFVYCFPEKKRKVKKTNR